MPTRREFLKTTAAGGTCLAAAGRFAPSLSADDAAKTLEVNTLDLPRGTAEHCVMIWLGGGACHIDTWDPKRRGDAKAGSKASSPAKTDAGMKSYPDDTLGAGNCRCF